MEPGKEKLIGEVLIEHDAVSPPDLEEALEIQKERGGRIVQILINLGHLTEERLLSCLGSQHGISSVSLRHYTIDPELTKIVPVRFAEKYEIMPLDKLGKNLTVAMAVPMDTATRVKLEEKTGMRIRAVLCSRGDVRSAIAQYYGVTPSEEAGAALDVESPATDRDAADVQPGPEAVRLKNITDLLNAIDEFPLLPHVHARLLQRVGAPDADVGEITTLIEQDPPLAANILRLANSAAYAARHRFDSVQRAVAYIGLRELHSVVISSAVLQAISEKTHTDLDHIFQQSFRCGLLTKILCDTAKVGDCELAFTAGLLHDLGSIVLRYFSQERLRQIESRIQEGGVGHTRAEEEVLGICASEICYHLLERWNIPSSLSDAIRFHDRLDSSPDPPAISVAIALALRCLDRESRGESFAAAATAAADSEAAELLAQLSMPPSALGHIHDVYLEGLSHITPLMADP